MTQTIKKLITGSVLFALLAAVLVIPGRVLAAPADIQGSLCAGVNLDVRENCDPSDADGENRINNLITSVINIFSLVVGVIAVIMIIIGGLKYIMSSGDSNNITSAKNTILYAIIGLVIVAMAQFIVKFVLSRATDTT